jgi:TATA-binding protein-associated factor
VRRLTARHRLILSGTPIQNNVTELWALFDFLLPGYLGTERQFHRRYARPILQSRETGRGSGSAGDQEAGVLALEALHRQTLPFILRRMKAGLEIPGFYKKTKPSEVFFCFFLFFLVFWFFLGFFI